MVAEKSARGLPGADGQGLEKQGHFLLTPALESQDRLGGGEQRAGRCRMGGCQQPEGLGWGARTGRWWWGGKLRIRAVGFCFQMTCLIITFAIKGARAQRRCGFQPSRPQQAAREESKQDATGSHSISQTMAGLSCPLTHTHRSEISREEL